METFTFYSGGKYHFRGFGEWVVSIDRAGRVHIEHHVGHVERFNDDFTMSSRERDTCWHHVDQVPFSILKLPDRHGVPDEPLCRFVLEGGSQIADLHVWANDIAARDDLAALVKELKLLIGNHAKQQAVF